MFITFFTKCSAIRINSICTILISILILLLHPLLGLPNCLILSDSPFKILHEFIFCPMWGWKSVVNYRRLVHCFGGLPVSPFNIKACEFQCSSDNNDTTGCKENILQELNASITLIMELVCSSETSVDIHQTKRRYDPKDSHLHTLHRENLKAHPVIIQRLIITNNLYACLCWIVFIEMNPLNGGPVNHL